MANPPRRPPPQKRKSGLPAGDAVASRAVVPKKRDPRQAGIFDRPLPAFVRLQVAKLVIEAPAGERWAHELKFDCYRMHARIDRGRVQLITARWGLDWTGKYSATAAALMQLSVARLSRWRALRRPTRRHDVLQLDAGCHRRGERRGARLLRFRSPLPGWRGSPTEAAA
jgi:hypothetical protein